MFLREERRQKRFRTALLALPIVLLGLGALVFGLADSDSWNKPAAPVGQGINLSLPGARLFKREPASKLSLAEQARQDSLNRKPAALDVQALDALGWGDRRARNEGGKIAAPAASAEQNATLLNRRLTELQRVVSRPVPIGESDGPDKYPADQPQAQLAKAEKMLQAKTAIAAREEKADPEMERLNSMLDKLLAIEHPDQSVNLRDHANRAKEAPDSAFRAIRAVVAGGQKVLQGSAVRLRLLDSLPLKGILVPRGSYVFASCQVVNQRLLLHIATVRLGTSLVPVDLSVYDMDGMEGIPAPSAVMGEALRSGSDNAVSGLQLLSMDSGIGAQAASAGVEAAKTIFSKKVHVIRVKLRDGYPVLLRNNRRTYGKAGHGE